MTEGDRWFHIAQDRKRAKSLLARRKRAAAKREGRLTERVLNQSIKMEIGEWTYDEFGNLSRTIYGGSK